MPFRRKALRWSGVATTVTALMMLWSAGEALAVCTPNAANNVTATCTGTTTNQNAPNGYGTGVETGITIDVILGATVTGTNNGLSFNSGTVTNSGTIIGTNQYGIYGSGNSIVNLTNSGTISGTIGISVTTVNVTNSGSISGPIAGINAFTTSVINQGSITSSGNIAIGAAFANVTNSGTISGTVAGISAWNVNVINSGSITSNNIAIVSTTNANVTNSGTIIGASGTAIQFAGNADTLTVLPGARFGGLINFGGGADTVNFGAGSWVLNTANFNNALSTINTGGNPYIVTANQIIVADVSGFGAMNRAVMDITGWMSSVLPETPVFEPAPAGAANAFAAIDAATSRYDDAFAAFPSDTLSYAPDQGASVQAHRCQLQRWQQCMGQGLRRLASATDQWRFNRQQHLRLWRGVGL